MVQGRREAEVVPPSTRKLGTTPHRAVPNMEVTEMEQVLKGAAIDKAELAKLIVELINNDPEVRGAIMDVAYSMPGLIVEY